MTKNIKFIWTPGHCWITGNERADELARLTVNNTTTEILSYSSLIDIHKKLNIHCFNLWELEWWRTPNNKLRETKKTTTQWPILQSFNRIEEVTIYRLRIGHTKLSHGHVMSKDEPSVCQSCGILLSVKHLLIYCRVYTEEKHNHKIPDNKHESPRTKPE